MEVTYEDASRCVSSCPVETSTLEADRCFGIDFESVRISPSIEHHLKPAEASSFTMCPKSTKLVSSYGARETCKPSISVLGFASIGEPFPRKKSCDDE